MTSPVELIKCLKSIKEHAFSASEYPVVITLEDHLTADLQAKTAEVNLWSHVTFDGHSVVLALIHLIVGFRFFLLRVVNYPRIYIIVVFNYHVDDYSNIWRHAVYTRLGML